MSEVFSDADDRGAVYNYQVHVPPIHSFVINVAATRHHADFNASAAVEKMGGPGDDEVGARAKLVLDGK